MRSWCLLSPSLYISIQNLILKGRCSLHTRMDLYWLVNLLWKDSIDMPRWVFLRWFWIQSCWQWRFRTSIEGHKKVLGDRHDGKDGFLAGHGSELIWWLRVEAYEIDKWKYLKLFSWEIVGSAVSYKRAWFVFASCVFYVFYECLLLSALFLHLSLFT